MTKIKICGLTREIDISYVNELEPEYVGFVFAKSKRELSWEMAEKLIKNLNRKIKTVGVFANEDVDKVKFIAEKLELDILQLHGNEDRDYIDKLSSFNIWKAISVKNIKDLDILKIYEKETVLLDSKLETMQGGTGIAFDWNMIKGLSVTRQLVLAGGLNESNVKEAIEVVKPYVVDVSSGVESLGFKNFSKIEQFIRKVRQI